MIDGLLRDARLGGDLGALVLGHALLEGLDALRDVTHQLGNLAAPEQQQHDADDDDPVPNTQATHWLILRPGAARRAQPMRGFGQNLGAGSGKNKDSQGRGTIPRGVYSSGGRGASARSRSPSSRGSSSSRSAGSSEGTGTLKPAGSAPSNRPAPLSSSRPGRSDSDSRPKCDKKASLVL